jgi:hypothetical protein
MANPPFHGTVQVEGTSGTIAEVATIVLDGDRATITVGAGSVNLQAGRPFLGTNGQMVLLNRDGQQVLHAFDATGGTIQLNGPDGAPGLHLGAGTADAGAKGAAIQLDGKNGDLVLRCHQNLAGVYQDSVVLRGSTADLALGGSGQPGTIVMLGGDAIAGNFKETIRLEGGTASLSLGGAGLAGTVVLKDGTAKDSIRIDAHLGDIQLLNADVAEEFDLSSSEPAEPGMVVVFGPDSHLRPCREPYDKRVAGVLSGAGDFRPGVVLDRRATGHTRRPLALMGKVFCRVDADFGRIETGDLLTTSATPGHAMKAADPRVAFGAVIGKAMTGLESGQGLIRVLVGLQ